MLVILTIGGLLVAGLLVWALTRTVDTTQTPVPSVAETATPALDTASNATASNATVSTGSGAFSPSASSTAGLATSSQAPVISGEKKDIPRISAEDLREKVNAGSVTVVDVRDNLSYQAGHIPGALSIPLASVEANLDLLPKGKQVITYCT
jgi:hypothetical protein